MTKKELLENKYFKELPEDTEIIFNSSVRISEASRLEVSHLSIVQEPCSKPVLRIDALPRDFLERKGLFIMPRTNEA